MAKEKAGRKRRIEEGEAILNLNNQDRAALEEVKKGIVPDIGVN